jgi:hypothetical protein
MGVAHAIDITGRWVAGNPESLLTLLAPSFLARQSFGCFQNASTIRTRHGDGHDSSRASLKTTIVVIGDVILNGKLPSVKDENARSGSLCGGEALWVVVPLEVLLRVIGTD